jgi:hypothetical protein
VSTFFLGLAYDAGDRHSIGGLSEPAV